MKRKVISKSISKQEDVIFNIVTAIDEEEYSKRMEDALKYDGIQCIIALY